VRHTRLPAYRTPYSSSLARMALRRCGLCLLAWPLTQAIRVAPSNSRTEPDLGAPCMLPRLQNVTMETYGSMADDRLQKAGLGGIYVCHWKKLPNRKASAKEQLDKLGLQANFIVGYDGEEMTDDDVRCMYPSNKVMHVIAKDWDFGANWMHTGELSLSLKHVKAAYEAVLHGHQHTLVLEDDFQLTENFTDRLTHLLEHTDEWLGQHGGEYDILWVGSYGHNHANDLTRPPQIIADTHNKGTIGYLLSLSGAKYLLSHMPINAPSDHMLGNNFTGTAPPRRFSHRPWLVEPMNDFGTAKGLATPKKSHFIRTPDIKDCFASPTHPKCPCTRPKNISSALIAAGCCCLASELPALA